MFGFVHLYCGQEAVSTGVLRAMEPRDYACSTYRDHVHALSKVRNEAYPSDSVSPSALLPAPRIAFRSPLASLLDIRICTLLFYLNSKD